MDDKTFVAAYAAQETQRINKALKDMINCQDAPSEEQKNAIIQDIETTLSRLHIALSHICTEISEEDHEPVVQ